MFRKIADSLQSYFGISKKEARGALVLMILCLVLLWFPFLFRRFLLPVLPIEQQPINIKMLDSLAVELEKANQSKTRKFAPFPKKDYQKKPPRSFRLSDFDPNTATVDQLETLGIPAFLARRIDKFRSKGGKFRKKEDLLNIYDFPSGLFHQLEKHIVFGPGIAPKKDIGKAEPSFESKRMPYPSAIKPARPVIAAFNINTADTTELIRLKGIGSKLSLRILKFRDALGGFYATDQYAEIYGLDSLALSELYQYCRVNSPVKKIDINRVTAEEIGNHPYFKNKRITSTIISYRSQHGPFRNMDDLRKVRVVDELMIQKITPYLRFE